ncbi:MAG: hypothetical protein JXA33_01890 [Anaerolineae bacterium]|nr:hypothetical protein [Anaerolineae bacterium]
MIKLRKNIGFVLLLCLPACCGLIGPPGSQQPATRAAQGVAFVDTNENGKYDKDEVPLPDVRLVAESNIHGSFTFLEVQTDTEGRATLQATYTHLFNIHAIPPCGYYPTTKMIHRADETSGKRFVFGFMPGEAVNDMATVHISVWEDYNRNGTHDISEPPFSFTSIAYVTIPRTVDQLSPTLMPVQWSTMLTTTTDVQGEVVLDLRSTCGTLQVYVPARGDEIEEMVSFSYDLGYTDVAWALPHARPANIAEKAMARIRLATTADEEAAAFTYLMHHTSITGGPVRRVGFMAYDAQGEQLSVATAQWWDHLYDITLHIEQADETYTLEHQMLAPENIFILMQE